MERKIDKILNKFPLIVGFLIFLAISWIVFKDYFLLKLTYYFKDIGSDTVNDLLPNYFHSKYIKQIDGNFYTWSFFKGLGEVAVKKYIINPIHFLTNLWKFLTGDNFWLYRFFGIFNYEILIFITSFFYFRTIKLEKLTSILFALSISFSGYFIVGSGWNHQHLIFKLIFLLFAYEQWLIYNRWYFFPFAVHFLSTNFFYLASAAIFMLFYSLARYYIEKNSLKKYLTFHLKVILIAFIATLANLINSYPTLYKMINAPRVAGDVNQVSQLLKNPENIDVYLRNVTTILRFFGNDILGTGSEFKGWYNYLEAPLFYSGLLTLILFPLSWFYFDKKEKIAYTPLVILALLIAFVPYIRHSFNFFIGNYYKGTVDFFVPFFLILNAAIVFDKILKNKQINDLALIITLGLLLILLHFPYFKKYDISTDFQQKIIISILLIGYGLAIYWLQKQNLAKYLILILAIIDFSYISSISIKNRQAYGFQELKTTLAGYNDGTFEALSFIKDRDTSFYRIEKDYSSGNAQHSSLNDAMVQGYFGTTRYSSFNQLSYIKFLKSLDLIKKGSEAQTRWVRGVRGIPLLMTFTSVKYFLAKDLNTKLKFSGFDSLKQINDILILRNKYYLPLGFTYDKVLSEKSFKKLSFFKKQQALLSAAIVSDTSFLKEKLKTLDTNNLVKINNFNFEIYGNLISSLKQDTLQITKFTNSKIEGKLNLSEDKILFLSIPFDKGWHAQINNKTYQLLEVNNGLSGIFLKKGDYKITIYYLPPYYTQAKIISIISIILLIGIFIYDKRKDLTKIIFRKT